MSTSDPAFLTIGQLSDELALPQHILRYWETKFSQLKPLTRAGSRRYYRPQDAELARQINHLLNVQGYTIKGVQNLLARGSKSDLPEVRAHVADSPVPAETERPSQSLQTLLQKLEMLREHLASALAADDRASSAR